MSIKYKTNSAFEAGQVFENTSDALSVIHICDVCKKEIEDDDFFEKGVKLTFRQKYWEMYLDVCETCYFHLKDKVEEMKNEQN